MGKAPAVIIITRHGPRLDGEDKSWQSSAEHPWDTPLSYGGWTQTRSLGARIASLLHARDIAVNDEDGVTRRRSSEASALDRPGSSHSTQSSHSSLGGASVKRKKHRVIVHSSPFLRCIQSSIAISAGMAQYQGNLAKFEAAGPMPPPKATRLFPSSRSHTLDSKAFADKYGPNVTVESFGPPPSSTSNNTTQPKPGQMYHGCPAIRLRVDAFLGEWLSPDYFEFITPPPPSKMMIARAKAELMKTGEPIIGAKLASDDVPAAPNAAQTDTNGQDKDASAFSTEELAKALPGHGQNGKSGLDSEDRRMRRVSFSSDQHGPTSAPAASSQSTVRSSQKTMKGYFPPQPTYAMLPRFPIPTGFVAHARDACVDIDFAWDSMQGPQNWGDGGEYGEEWSSMHTRFRKGLRDMVQWYKRKTPDFNPSDANSDETADASGRAADPSANSADDDDDDLVLVIVTHGAGCNALIGALTNQPVLMDVGMASLTMATHKGREAGDLRDQSVERRSSIGSGGQRRRRRSSIDVGLSLEYDMKLLASSDHLRAGADPLAVPHLSSPHMMPAIPERRLSTASSNSAAAFDLEGRPRARNSALGSIRRKNTATSASSRSFTGPRAGSVTSAPGLWGGSRQSTLDVSLANDDDEVNGNDGAYAAEAVFDDDDADGIIQSPIDVKSSPIQRPGSPKENKTHARNESATLAPPSMGTAALQSRANSRSGSGLWNSPRPSGSGSGLWNPGSRNVSRSGTLN